MNRERFREKVDALLRQYSPLVAGTDECDKLRWELNELLDPANDGPCGFIDTLTVHEGRIVVKVYVPDRAELDADEWCAALQEYTGDALVVEPAGDVAELERKNQVEREALKKMAADLSAAYATAFAGGVHLPGATGVLTGSFGTWAVDGFSIDPDDRPELPAFGEKTREWVGTTASVTALPGTGNKALAAAHQAVRQELTRPRGAKGKPKRW